MKASWDDIERCLVKDTLEDQGKERLEAFSRVEPPPSSNPKFHFRFQQAQERIKKKLEWIYADERHAKLEEKQKAQSPKNPGKDWHEKPVGKVVIGIIIGTIVLVIGIYIKLKLGV